MRRVGILGGTFDPIHNGHLDAGRAAQRALDLGEILVVPSNIPPHRPQPVASSYHRFAMVALAIAGRSGWRAIDIELQEIARSYTSNTLQRFHADGFSAGELFFITGADAFVEIATWKDYPSLLDLAHFAVISRRGISVGALPERLPALASRMRTPSAGAEALASPAIFLIDEPTADVSSTAIRLALAHGRSIVGMVPSVVQLHIEQHGLYQHVAPAAEAGRGEANPAAGRLHGQE